MKKICKEGYNMVLSIYELTSKFPESEINNLTSQLRRASASIQLNIAEGSTRSTERAFLQFLNYAYGSCKEIEVLLSLSRDLNYINISDYSVLSDKINK